VRAAIFARPVVAVSPIVHGEAVKGPLASMIRDLARTDPTPAAIAAHYGPRLRGLVVERGDEASVTSTRVLATDTIMKTRADSARLAREVLACAEGLT
jgi:LPPG:FO 2-phospho-L-lactate transferase